MLLCDLCQNYNTSPLILPVTDIHLHFFKLSITACVLNDFFTLVYKTNQVSMYLILGYYVMPK